MEARAEAWAVRPAARPELPGKALAAAWPARVAPVVAQAGASQGALGFWPG